MLHLNIQNGLPSNNAYHVLQDRNGYWWISTDNGIVKYNGYSLRVFNTSDGLLTNDIFACYEDSRRRLWMQCHTYQVGYIKDNVFRKVQPVPTKNIIVTSKYIEHTDGNIYFSYRDSVNKVVRIDTNDRVHVFEEPLQIVGASGNEYLRTSGNKLQQCIIEGNAIKVSDLCTRPLVNDSAFSYGGIYAYHKVFSYRFKDHEMSVLNAKECRVTKYTVSGWGGDAKEKIHLFYSKKNSAFIITDRNIYVFDTAMVLKDKIDIAGLVPYTSQVSFFFKDNFRHTWYTTVSDGVWIQAGHKSVFQAGTRLKYLSGCDFAGTVKNGMSFWWNKDKKTMLVVSPDFKLVRQENFVEDLKFVSDACDHKVYLCFSNGSVNGLDVYDLLTGEVHNFYTEKETLSVDRIDGINEVFKGTRRLLEIEGFFNIHQYKPDTLFGSTRLSFTAMLIKGSDRIVAKALFTDRYPYSLYDTVNKKYWFYNEAKIVCLDPANLTYAVLNDRMLNALGLNSIRRITADGHGNLFVLAGNKLVVYNPRLARIRYIPANFDLSGAFIEVYNDILLLAGRFGIAYAKLQGPLSVSGFKITPNFKSHYYNRIYSFVVNSAGNIIVNTDMDTYGFHIDSLFKDAAQFTDNQKKFMQLVISHPQQLAVHQGDTFYLSQRTEKINFDLINIYGLGSPQYQYRIDGGDWQQSQTGEVYLPGIKPATYYKVQCIASDDVWKSKPYTFYIYKIPYWYQTTTWFGIFWVSGTLLFVVLLLSVILLTRNIVARANDKKRQMIELELRAIHSQINPHFIFNTLGTALFFINKKNMDEAYLHVNKFSRLLRSYLKSSRNRYITLADEIEMIRNYIELQQTRFENKFAYRVEVENKIPANSVQIPSLLLQPLVENAINHGLFHLPNNRQGLLVLRFYQGSNSNELICTIEDNGIGRDKAKEIKKDSVVQYESYGTALTKELIDIFRQYENMNILLEYIDKTLPETGTIVKLTIKNLKYVA